MTYPDTSWNEALWTAKSPWHLFLRRELQPEKNISRAKGLIVSQIFILLTSSGEKILSNVNVVVWGQVKSENSSFPVAVAGWLAWKCYRVNLVFPFRCVFLFILFISEYFLLPSAPQKRVCLNTERSYITRLRCSACQSQIPTDGKCFHLIGLFTQV